MVPGHADSQVNSNLAILLFFLIDLLSLHFLLLLDWSKNMKRLVVADIHSSEEQTLIVLFLWRWDQSCHLLLKERNTGLTTEFFGNSGLTTEFF